MATQWDREVDGAVEQGPFTAVTVVPGDLGTYPGSTIAPVVVVGYLAALHASATTTVSVTPSESAFPKEKEPLA